jgi:predicted ABC-type transport system involved in lysophospholipase L1 biosynthesis ATPase subunit
MKPDPLCLFRGKHTGYVFQSHRLVPYLTALENILLPISASGQDRSRVEHRLSLLIDRLALGDRLNHLPCELSGGQQQRVAIARALIHYPMILFADEPTGNLDRATADHVTDLLVSLRDELNQTLVIVTHDEALANRADRAYRMEAGELYVKR